MSITLYEFAKSFVNGKISADVFADPYIELWYIEGDNGLLLQDSDQLSLCLSSTFCLADTYNPDSDRDEYEFDENELRERVALEINQYEDSIGK